MKKLPSSCSSIGPPSDAAVAAEIASARLPITTPAAKIEAPRRIMFSMSSSLSIGSHSNIWLLCDWHLPVKQMRLALGADLFVPLLLPPPIASHSAPRLVESVRVVHREDHFHPLAAVEHSPSF